MRLGLQLGLAMQQGRILTLSQRVETILTGTNATAWDPSETTRLFQLSGGTGAVTAAADPIGYDGSKWGNTARNFIQATAGFRPAWNGTAGIDFDGTDDFLDLASSSWFQNVGSAFVCMKIFLDAVGSNQLFYSGANVSNSHRFAVLVNAGGSITHQSRRLDADALNSFTSSAGVITALTEHVVTAEVDYAGTGAARLWVDGTLVVNSTISGVAGNTSNTATSRCLWGIFDSGANRVNGRIGRRVAGPILPSAADRATIEAWVDEVALT